MTCVWFRPRLLSISMVGSVDAIGVVCTPKVTHMLKRHFRLIEALGILVALVAWGLNTLSVERWGEIQAAHQRMGEKVLEAYTSSQLTANMMLNSAIIQAAKERPDQQGTDLAYERAWFSLDVRRAWLLRLYNNVTGLRILADHLHDIDKQHELGHAESIRELSTQLEPIEQRVQTTLGGKKGWVAAPTFDKDAIPAKEATDLDVTVVTVAEPVLTLQGKLADALTDRRKQATRIHIGVFFIGTLLLIVAKTAEWRVDLGKPAVPGEAPAIHASNIPTAPPDVPLNAKSSRTRNQKIK